MTRIVIDDVLRDELIGLKEPVWLHDGSGHVVSRARPANDASSDSGRETASRWIVIDAALRDKLIDLEEPAELCDSWGLVVARVMPLGGEERPGSR